MKSIEAETKIMQYIRSHSGFETHRPYLGMSHLGQCPRRLYDEFMFGQPADDRAHLGAFAGYSMEKIEMELLIGAGIAKEAPWELECNEDPLLRGHIDAETVDGDLLEIKSVNTRKFETVTGNKRPQKEHFEQVQAYMHFGHYRNTLIVYVCRETFQHAVFEVPYVPSVANRLIANAKKVLQAIHEQKRPECECGRCK